MFQAALNTNAARGGRSKSEPRVQHFICYTKLDCGLRELSTYKVLVQTTDFLLIQQDYTVKLAILPHVMKIY